MVVRVDGKKYGPAASHPGPDPGAFLERPTLSRRLRRLLKMAAYITFATTLSMSLLSGTLRTGKGGPHLAPCKGGFHHMGVDCEPPEFKTRAGTLQTLRSDQVCLVYSVFLPSRSDCFETASLWRAAHWIGIGGLVELHFDQDGRVTSVSRFSGSGKTNV